MGTPVHGINGVLYLSPGTGAAIEIGELKDYSIETDTDLQDVTALGDAWDRMVRGAMRWTLNASGNFDKASKSLWLAAVATTVQSFYLYPDRSVTTSYYYGQGWVKAPRVVAGGVRAASSVSLQIAGNGAHSLN